MANDLIDVTLLSLYDKRLKTVASILQRATDYVKGDVVHYNGKYVKCTTAGTTDTARLTILDTSNIGDSLTDGTVVWEVFDPFEGAGISDWEQNRAYKQKDLVIYSNKLYRCLNAHTSTTSFSDNELDWVLLSGGGATGGLEKVTLYTSSTFSNTSQTITVEDLSSYDYITLTYSVSNDGANTLASNTEVIDTKETGEHLLSVYIDISNYMNLTMDISALTSIVFSLNEVAGITHYKINSIVGVKVSGEGESSISTWEVSTEYTASSLVIHNNKLYQCKADHTSDSSDFNNDIDKWQEISATQVLDWVSGSNYSKDDVAIYDNSIGIADWVAGTIYNPTDKVINDNTIYECITASSDTAFDSTKWTKIADVSKQMYRCVTANNDTTFTESNWETFGGKSYELATDTDIDNLFK